MTLIIYLQKSKKLQIAVQFIIIFHINLSFEHIMMGNAHNGQTRDCRVVETHYLIIYPQKVTNCRTICYF